jgi:O-antigen/teichoic acid export membrane protein
MSEALPSEKLLIGENDIVGARHDAPSTGIVSRNSVIAMVGGLVSQGLKLLVIVYLARVLPVSDFGRVSFAIAVNAYMYIASHFGLPVLGSRAVATSGVVSRGLLFEIAYSRACLAFASMAVSIAILWLVPGISSVEITMVAIFGISNVVQAGLFDWVFQGLHRQAASAVLNIIWQGGWLALTVAGVRAGMGVVSVPVALAGSALIAAGAGYLWLRQTTDIRRGDKDHVGLLNRASRILGVGAPLGWGTLLVTVLIWSDTLFVRLLRGQEAAGLYAAGNRPALALAMLSSFYVQGAFPLLSQAAQVGTYQLNACFQHCYEDMALIYVPGSVWAISYAREIVLLAFRKTQYLAAVPVFRVFQVILVLAALSNLFGIGVFVATHRDRDYQRVLLLSAIVFIPVCGFLTVFRGNAGASLAALLAQMLVLGLFLVRGRGIVRPNHAAAVLKPLVVGLAVILVSRAMRLTLFPSAALLVVSYAILVMARFRILLQAEGAS